MDESLLLLWFDGLLMISVLLLTRLLQEFLVVVGRRRSLRRLVRGLSLVARGRPQVVKRVEQFTLLQQRLDALLLGDQSQDIGPELHGNQADTPNVFVLVKFNDLFGVYDRKHLEAQVGSHGQAAVVLVELHRDNALALLWQFGAFI